MSLPKLSLQQAANDTPLFNRHFDDWKEEKSANLHETSP